MILFLSLPQSPGICYNEDPLIGKLYQMLEIGVNFRTANTRFKPGYAIMGLRFPSQDGLSGPTGKAAFDVAGPSTVKPKPNISTPYTTELPLVT